MAAQNYDEALRLLLKDEGGYTNHPDDPGGPTNYGITIFDYRKYVKPNATAADVKAMKLSEAKAIYRTKYWDAQHCDDLPSGIDYAVFDYGVNSGIGRAPKVLQRVLGVAADGAIGPNTLRAARSANAVKIINGICDERIAFLRSLRTWPVFGKGWAARVKGVRATALRMASAPIEHPPPDIPAPEPQAAQQPARSGGLFNGLAALTRILFRK